MLVLTLAACFSFAFLANKGRAAAPAGPPITEPTKVRILFSIKPPAVVLPVFIDSA